MFDHLKENKFWDCKYSMKWISENIKECRIDKNYKDRHEPALWGVSISVKLPESDLWAELAANDEGWLYVSDRGNVSELPKISIMEGIKAVEINAMNWEVDKYKEKGGVIQ